MAIFILIIIAAVVLAVVLHNSGKTETVREIEAQTLADQQRQEQIGYLEIMRRERQKLEILRQANIVGDQATVDAVLADRYDGPMPQLWSNETAYNSIYPDRLLIVNIAGINYRSGIRTYVGEFNGVLVPDPKNDYDPEAIKIKAEDGHHLGFVPEYMTYDVRQLIGHPDITDTKWKHRVTGYIDEHEDYSGRKRRYFTGYINVIAQ